MDHYFAVCYTQAIGVARTGTIPDSSFSSLSNYNLEYAAKYGRLNGTKSWAPNGNNNANDYCCHEVPMTLPHLSDHILLHILN